MQTVSLLEKEKVHELPTDHHQVVDTYSFLQYYNIAFWYPKSPVKVRTYLIMPNSSANLHNIILLLSKIVLLL